MSDRLCPACRTSLEGNVSADGVCMNCGHDLVVTAPGPAWSVGGMDLRAVARRQRSLLWLFLGLICLQAGPLVVQSAAPTQPTQIVSVAVVVLSLSMQLIALIVIIRLMAALNYNMALRILLTILMFAPCVNLLILLSINSRATAALRAAGLHVGFMGVPDEQVVRALSPNRCHRCGYLLLGNTSGICPECGQIFASATTVQTPPIHPT